MKTLISIPNDLVRAADRMARQLGISRSELFQRAIARFVEPQTGNSVREALDAVYERGRNRNLDPAIRAASEHLLADEDW